jgi:hypothetical protein
LKQEKIADKLKGASGEDMSRTSSRGMKLDFSPLSKNSI